MHDLNAIYNKIAKVVEKFLNNDLNEKGNFRYYPNPPKMSDKQIIILSLCSESLGIDSESYFLSKLKTDYADFFPNVHITRYNKRRKYLADKISRLTQLIADDLSFGEDYFMVDSMPVPVCKMSRELQTKVCRENFETACDKGYSAVNKQYYIGYKLHLVVSLNGVYKQMDITKASVHDVGYLNDIKHGSMRNCTLLGDAGYVSAPYQLDLFESVQINLETPRRSNQKDFKRYPYIFKKSRKRIETLFSQLTDQFMMKRNYAKTFVGLASRIIAKVAGLTILQYINKTNGKPINKIKHALAF
jgi:hypothetical protein